MIKTKEWLKSVFETGDVPTGEDYENLMDSFWHKSETGQVAEGDEQPVTGGAVYAAIALAIAGLNIRDIVRNLLGEMLPTLLEEYVNVASLSDALSRHATVDWVRTQLDSKADTLTVVTALAEKVSTEALTDALAAKVNTADLTTALAQKANTTDVNTALAAKADVNSVYTKAEADVILATKAPNSSLPDTSILATKAELTAAQALINAALAAKANAADVPTSADWLALSTAIDAKVAQASNSATAAARSAEDASDSADEAASSASSVSSISGRVSALETTVGNNNSGLVKRMNTAEGYIGNPAEVGKPATGLFEDIDSIADKIGEVPDKVDISTSLNETREKTNEMIAALNEDPEIAELLKDVSPLDEIFELEQ